MAGLFGCGHQIAEHGVGQPIGLEHRIGRVVEVQAFNNVDGSQGSPSRCECLDSSSVVAVVTERGDPVTAARGDGSEDRYVVPAAITGALSHGTQGEGIQRNTATAGVN